MALRNLSPRSQRAYSSDYDAFAAWLGGDRVQAVTRFLGLGRPAANALATDWLGEMRQQQLAPASRARRLSALKALVRAARRLGVVDWALDVDAPKVENYRDTRGPNQETALRMLSLCDESTLEGLRNRALLLFVLTLGLRRHELAAVRAGHFVDGRLRVVGKGEKVAWFTPGPAAIDALERWVTAWRAQHPEDTDSDVVWRSLSGPRYGQPLGSKGVYDVVVELGRRAGIKVWPHALRHTAITTGLDETDGNLRAVQRFGRHSDPKVTARYDDNRQDLAASVARRLDAVFGKRE